jgi:AcrR family transcriptional regulator
MKPLTMLSPSAQTADAKRILDAAERLFLDFGHAGFTMDRLAEALGMSKKTLYKHYESKDEILAKVLDARSMRLDRELTALLAREEPDFHRKMVTFIAYVVDRFAEISEPFLQDVRRGAPELFRKIEEYREQAIPRHMVRLLDEGIQAGVFRDDIPAEVAIGVLLHAAQNMLLPRPGRARLARTTGELMDLLVKLVLEGIMVRGESGKKSAAKGSTRATTRKSARKK